MIHDLPPRGRLLAAEGRLPPERVALVDLLDRLLAGGAVITGDVILSIADIDLVRISLRALIMSVRASEPLDTAVPGTGSASPVVWNDPPASDADVRERSA
ncbi:gas vesicle protein [Sphaerisporangium fuscum]|uniref:gas vesicle protein n=1 Tax=Sphaerisporangium fuscum TaxID=2835868 RepID=UPI001BDD0E99|nr:gas vesicle protein [Sphaerisporangium fuscum]